MEFCEVEWKEKQKLLFFVLMDCTFNTHAQTHCETGKQNAFKLNN